MCVDIYVYIYIARYRHPCGFLWAEKKKKKLHLCQRRLSPLRGIVPLDRCSSETIMLNWSMTNSCYDTSAEREHCELLKVPYGHICIFPYGFGRSNMANFPATTHPGHSLKWRLENSSRMVLREEAPEACARERENPSGLQDLLVF